MKTNNIKNLARIIFTIVLLMIFSYSCKKSDLKSDKVNETDAAIIKKAKQEIAEKMKTEGIHQVFPRKQKIETQWVDENKKPVTKDLMQNSNFTSACNYDLPDYCTLIQYTRTFHCDNSSNSGSFYTLQFEYELSWNNNIITDVSGSTTEGLIEIYEDATNKLVQSISLDVPGSDVKIQLVGPDPNHTGYYIWRVKFITGDYSNDKVPSSYINGDVVYGTYTIKLSANFVTDCKTSPYSLWLLPVTMYGFTGDNAFDPCKRNDEVGLNWNLGGSFTNRLVVIGFDPVVSLPCGGYGGLTIKPDLFQVQYSIDGGLSWNYFKNDVTASNTLGIYNYDPTSNSCFIRQDDFARSEPLTQGVTYDVILRYRNWKYSGSIPNSWPIPTPSTACFSIGDPLSQSTNTPNESNYAYKYIPGVVW
ncbi:MAG: hypothetical protein KF825_12100 [Ferruginibacter sp.]|nr:hypothetical protein [Ferruginibacter sp.]